MLVIHPSDRTTEMLSKLYEGKEIILLNQRSSNADIKKALYHCHSGERIMLLGHGSDEGLFSREDDTKDFFDRKIINHSHGYMLRRHPGNIIGIWCNADLFARKEGLHGLFSGMIVTEMSEALEYGISTSEEELVKENNNLAENLKFLLDQDIPLHAIPEKILEMDNSHTELTKFNYNNFHYL